MPTNQCAPCSNGCDPAQGVGNETDFWQRALRILCQVALGIEEIALATGAAQPANATVTQVPDSAVVQDALTADINRRGAIFENQSDQTAYIKLGAGASSTDYTVSLSPGSSFVLPSPVYTGLVTVIWDADSTGQLQVTEILP